ncbi:rod-determining factor RdfA [Halovenus sp. HT40]|uniref:rod-determining factor RdfA n=1 Tax=Halovenus sp. HT40 TaxID=3126691 RepID=UPI00300EA20D
MTESEISCCKVGRVAEVVGIDVDRELADRWTGEDRQSTRELADWFNRKLLAAELTAAGIPTKDGEVDNYYRLLTDDAVSSGDRIETRRELEQRGVSVDTLDERFVSHQTIHTHLTECLEASLSEPTLSERIDDAETTLGQLQSRTEAVTDDTITRLASHDALDIGSIDVLVSVQVACRECNHQYSVRELLDRGGCHCTR